MSSRRRAAGLFPSSGLLLALAVPLVRGRCLVIGSCHLVHRLNPPQSLGRLGEQHARGARPAGPSRTTAPMWQVKPCLPFSINSGKGSSRRLGSSSPRPAPRIETCRQRGRRSRRLSKLPRGRRSRDVVAVGVEGSSTGRRGERPPPRLSAGACASGPAARSRPATLPVPSCCRGASSSLCTSP